MDASHSTLIVILPQHGHGAPAAPSCLLTHSPPSLRVSALPRPVPVPTRTQEPGRESGAQPWSHRQQAPRRWGITGCSQAFRCPELGNGLIFGQELPLPTPAQAPPLPRLPRAQLCVLAAHRPLGTLPPENILRSHVIRPQYTQQCQNSSAGPAAPTTSKPAQGRSRLPRS